MSPKELFPGGTIAKATCHAVYYIAEKLIHPYQLSLSALLSLFLPTTVEKQQLTEFVLKACLLTIPYLVLNICMIPFALIGGILRIIVQPMRSSYVYSRSPFPLAVMKYKTEYSVASVNTCLFHEAANRFNNLIDSNGRAKHIGERIVIDQFYYKDLKVDEKDNLQNVLNLNASIDQHFPHLDFLCFQEVWQRSFARPLITELEKVYPYIVYDPGHWSLGCNYFLFNSGLMFASRYEILDVDFKPFSHKCNFCVVNSKGLLMLKVLLNTTDSKRYVGYIFLTHLQAYQGEKQVLDKQLDEIILWTEEFRRGTSLGTDMVKFDFLCGDFNFDNMSPCDKDLQGHGLFDLYDDPCRERPGLDSPWTVGTEFRQNRLWDNEVSTPEGLQAVLKDPIQRQRYMVDADLKMSCIDAIVNDDGKFDKHGNVVASPVGGRRRVDYALRRKDCARSTKFKFISRLATLTDHIPVTLTVEVD